MLRGWCPGTWNIENKLLSNCDTKIITKALAIRMNQSLNEIIDHNQTAYVKGRPVAVNLRSMIFIKDYFLEEQS